MRTLSLGWRRTAKRELERRVLPSFLSRNRPVRRVGPLILLCAAACDAPADPNRNRPPVAVGTIDDIILEQGDTTSVEVSGYFSDPDGGTLAYTAGTSDTDVVWVSSSGSVVTLRGVSAGAATVTVTAADSDGGEAEQSFGVAVTGVPVVNLAVDTASAPESGGVVLPLVLSRPPRESIFVSYTLGIDDDANTLDPLSANGHHTRRQKMIRVERGESERYGCHQERERRVAGRPRCRKVAGWCRSDRTRR